MEAWTTACNVTRICLDLTLNGFQAEQGSFQAEQGIVIWQYIKWPYDISTEPFLSFLRMLTTVHPAIYHLCIVNIYRQMATAKNDLWKKVFENKFLKYGTKNVL